MSNLPSRPQKKKIVARGFASAELAKIRVAEYKEIGELVTAMRVDYQIEFAESIISANVKAAESTITSDSNDARVALLCGQLQKLWDDSLTSMLECFAFGRVAFEKVPGYNAGFNLSYFAKLESLPFDKTEMTLGQDGSFDGIELDCGSKDALHIPADNSWWLALDPTAIEPHGKSRFIGSPMKIWKERQEAIGLRAVLRKKMIVMGGVFHCPLTDTLENGEVVDNAVEFAAAHDARMAGGVMVLSNERDKDGNYVYDYTETATTLDLQPLDDTIDGMDMDQLQAFGIPPKTVMEGQTAGLGDAGTSQQMVTLYATCEDVLGQIEASFQKYVIDKTVEANALPAGTRIRISHVPLGKAAGAAAKNEKVESGPVAGPVPTAAGSPNPNPTAPATIPPGGVTLALPAPGGDSTDPLKPTMLPTLDELREHGEQLLNDLLARLVDELDSLRRTHGHVDPMRVTQIVAEINTLHADLIVSGKILGVISPWIPEVNALPDSPSRSPDQIPATVPGTVPGATAMKDLALPTFGLFNADGYRFPWLYKAVNWLLGRKVATQAEFAGMDAAAKAQTATAPAIPAAQIEKLKNYTGASLLAGDDFKQFQDRIQGEIDLTESQAQTQFRTATKSAYVEGMESSLAKPEIADQFPFLLFVDTCDTRTRPTHRPYPAGLGNVMIRRDDADAYAVFRAALADWNCRCTHIPLNADQAKRYTLRTYNDLPADVRLKYGSLI